MKDGHCPKCGSHEVYHGPDIPIWNADTMGVANTFLHRIVPLRHYLCAECGYVESYLANLSDIPHITKQWTRVSDNTPS